MCGRFGLFARLDAIEDRFEATFDHPYEPRYNIAPGGSGIPTIRNDDPTTIGLTSWGFVPEWAAEFDDWPAPINARAETVVGHRTFGSAFEHRRCLLPASGFFEWTGRRGHRIPHWITVTDADLCAMAGIWTARETAEGDVYSTAIITTDANEVVARLHDRMPVILEPDEEDRWLAGDDAAAILDPYPAAKTATTEVGRSVNDPTVDGPNLVEPVDGEQTGLDAF